VIVVDDGSTDATADLVGDPGLVDVRTTEQGDRGTPAALNTGVDGDTAFEPDSLTFSCSTSSS